MERRKLFTELKSTGFNTLYEWTAPDRLWKEKNKSWFVKYGLIFSFFILFAALIGQFLFLITILCFAFLWYIQGIIPPEYSRISLTNLGVKAFGRVIKWQEIKHFWFSEKNGEFLLNLDTLVPFSNNEMRVERVSLVVNNYTLVKEIFSIIVEHCDYGDKEEVGFNFLLEILLGKHISMDEFLDKEIIEDSKDVIDVV